MEITYAIYRISQVQQENVPDRPVLKLIEFEGGFESEIKAVERLKKSNFAGGDYMILPSYYKHQPDN